MSRSNSQISRFVLCESGKLRRPSTRFMCAHDNYNNNNNDNDNNISIMNINDNANDYNIDDNDNEETEYQIMDFRIRQAELWRDDVKDISCNIV